MICKFISSLLFLFFLEDHKKKLIGVLLLKSIYFGNMLFQQISSNQIPFDFLYPLHLLKPFALIIFFWIVFTSLKSLAKCTSSSLSHSLWRKPPSRVQFKKICCLYILGIWLMPTKCHSADLNRHFSVILCIGRILYSCLWHLLFRYSFLEFHITDI